MLDTRINKREGFAAPVAILDRAAVLLSGLCIAHCLATTLFVGLLASFSTLLHAPIVHEAGLVLAMLIGAIALGLGQRRHGLKAPLLLGGVGLMLMALALTQHHGIGESTLTMAGVSVLAFAHRLNQRSFQTVSC